MDGFPIVMLSDHIAGCTLVEVISIRESKTDKSCLMRINKSPNVTSPCIAPLGTARYTESELLLLHLIVQVHNNEQ